MEKEIEPTKIEPTNIEPTEITPTDIKPTEITPAEITPTEITPTEIKPTEIKPTDIKPTEIKPTEIKPTTTATQGATKPTIAKPKFSGKLVATYLFLSLACGVVTLALGLSFGLSWTLLPVIVSAVLSLFAMFSELKKLEITQEMLDEWNNEILKKHPNFNKSNLMTLQDASKALNKLSYWTHTLKMPVLKIGTWLVLSTSVLSLGLGIVLPLSTGKVGSAGGGNVVGVYVQAQQHETRNNIAQVGRTAWRFDSNGNAYFTGYYNGGSTAWQSYGKYTKSGSTVRVSALGSAYFNIKSSGKALAGSDGTYWIKV